MEDKKVLEDLASFFKMFSDPTRLKILGLLFQQDMNVQALADACQMSHSSISHQLAKLREARLVKTTKVAQQVIYSLDDDHIKDIYNSGLVHIKEEYHYD